jgi:hypothetical protein
MVRQDEKLFSQCLLLGQDLFYDLFVIKMTLHFILCKIFEALHSPDKP